MDPLAKSALSWVGAIGLLAGAWATGFLMGTDRGSTSSTDVSSRTALASTSRNPSQRLKSQSSASDESQLLRAIPFERRLRVALQETDFRRRQRGLDELADSLAPADFVAAIKEAEKLPDDDQFEVLSLLVARWAELEPQEAVEAARARGESWAGSLVIESALSVWVGADADGALAWFNGFPRGREHDQLIGPLVHALARSRPETAFQILQGSDYLKCDPSTLERVLGAWVRQDPGAATAAAERQAKVSAPGRPRMEHVALQAVAKAWATADPAAALVWAQQLADPQQRGEALKATFAGWASVSADAALQAATALPAGEARSLALAAVSEVLAHEDPRAAAGIVRQLPPGTAREDILNTIVPGLRLSDPPLAASLVAEMAPGSQREQSSGTLASLWARTNLPEALAWAQTLAPGKERQRSLSEVVSHWCNSDPKAALSWFLKNEPLLENDHAIGHPIARWVFEKADEALAWIKTLPDGASKGMLMGYAISELARKDAPRAAELLARSLPAQAQAGTVSKVAGEWLLDDPVAATAWAARLEEEHLRAEAFGAMAREWPERDLDKAGTWLERLPPGAPRDRAAGTLADRLFDTNPSEALRLAGTITDGKRREALITPFLETWVTHDKPGAQRWISTNGTLSPALRERLRDFHP